MGQLPSVEEFEKLSPEKQKELVDATSTLVEDIHGYNRAERRKREKRIRQLRKQERKQNG